MNIFVLDENPMIAAQMHCDKHVSRMILDYTQMLYAAHVLLDGDKYKLSTNAMDQCSKWVRQSYGNYFWVFVLLERLLNEYRFRYKKIHSYENNLFSLGEAPIYIEYTGTQPFVQCMPLRYHQEDTVLAYRDYYWREKRNFATWKYPALKPQWWIDKEECEYAAQT
jgi:hypothetical protein